MSLWLAMVPLDSEVRNIRYKIKLEDEQPTAMARNHPDSDNGRGTGPSVVRR